MDSEPGKLFVGGISAKTTEEDLKDHFSKYGQVLEAVIIKDRFSGYSRGFGFVLFSEPDLADKAIQDHHVILSKTVEVRRAEPRGGRLQRSHGRRNSSNGNAHHNQPSTKKIFVGGLAASVTEEEFKAYFERFGAISDVVVMFDSVTHRARGFGFITFDSEEAVENVMQQPFHMLQNKYVEVKRAVPKDGLSSNSGNYTNNQSAGVAFHGGYPYGMQYHGGVFPRYGPVYNTFMSYSPPFYPYGTYTVAGYGYGPAPRYPWNGPGLLGVGQAPISHGNAPFYPSYANGIHGGYTGMLTNNYHGNNGHDANGQGRNSDTQQGGAASPVGVDGENLGEETSDDNGNGVLADSKQNSSQKVAEGELNTSTDINSS